jgi:hypothetical protein
MSVSGATPENKQIGENRFAIFLVTIVAATIGLGLMCLETETTWLFPWFLGWATLLAIWRVRSLDHSPGRAPGRSVLEYLLTTLAAVFSYQIFLMVALIPTTLVFMLLGFANQIGSWFGATWELPTWRWTVWTGAFIGVFCVYTASSLVVNKVRSQLYPPQRDGRSAFHEMAVTRKRKLAFIVAMNVGSILLIASAVLWYNGRIGSGFWILLTIYLLGCASQIYGVGDPSNTEKKAIAALTRLFEAIGCEVIPEPKTSVPAVDRLLGGLDLVAHNEDRVWGVSVKGADEKGAPIDWTVGAGLLSALQAYREKRPQFAGIEPVIVLVGTEADESLASFSRDQGVRVVQLDLPTIEKVIAETNQDHLSALGNSLFVGDPVEIAVAAQVAVAAEGAMAS